MGMNFDEFKTIVERVAEETPCCDGVEVDGSKVKMHWHSNKGHTYTERYDLDDDGSITGRKITCSFPPPPPGSTVPGIFENKLCRAIRQALEGRE